jgi:hypothetical protein
LTLLSFRNSCAFLVMSSNPMPLSFTLTPRQFGA